MSRLAILFLSLALLCGASDAAVRDVLLQAESAIAKVHSMAMAPIRVINTFLGFPTTVPCCPPNMITKTLTAQVRDSSDLITIIKSPRTPLGISQIIKPPNSDTLEIFEGKGDSDLDLQLSEKKPAESSGLMGSITSGVASLTTNVVGGISSSITKNIMGRLPIIG